MPSCSVKGCTNRPSEKSYRQEELEKTIKITFHAFPKCPTKRQLWLNSLGLQNSVLPKHAVVCSVHFKHADVDRTSLACVRLREHAVPYIKFPEIKEEEISIEEPWISEIIKEKNIDVCEEISTEEPSTSVCSDSYNTSSTVIIAETGNSVEFTEPMSITGGKRRHLVNTGSHEVSKKLLKIESDSKNEHMGALLQTSDKSTEAKVSLVDKHTCISPKKLFHSPRKEILRKHISALKRKHQLELAALNAKINRRDKRITNLQTVLQTLIQKNLLEGDQVHSLSGISQFNSELFDRMTRKTKKLSVARTYSPELRLFSLTLHYYSPRAYCYVREKLGLCLPHPKSLYTWYRSIDGEPGFNDEAIRHVKAYSDSLNEPLFVTLIFDEIAIRQHIEFDGQRCIGFVDVGKAFACDKETVAKEALVFLLVGLNKAWKLPVGYFLIDKINGEQKANLVQHCLRLLHETGMRVVSITCDGVSCNMAMSRILGCDYTDLVLLQTSFPHPVTQEPIYFVLDPSHMIKLVRNTLGDYKCILNDKNEKIEWKYIENLHKLQEREELHLANKLRKQHIEYGKKKMKVKLATQVLSSSVSNALCLCRSDLKLDGFENSEATEEFLQKINDILNSRNLRQKQYKRPLNNNNYSTVSKRLEQCEKYLIGLKLENGQQVALSKRRTGILGFLICNVRE